MSGSEDFRVADYTEDGGLHVMMGDQREIELIALREWMDRLATKIERINTEGCSHRTDDIARLGRVQTALEELERTVNTFRVEVTNQMAAIKLWVAVGALSLCVGAAGWVVTMFIRHVMLH